MKAKIEMSGAGLKRKTQIKDDERKSRTSGRGRIEDLFRKANPLVLFKSPTKTQTQVPAQTQTRTLAPSQPKNLRNTTQVTSVSSMTQTASRYTVVKPAEKASGPSAWMLLLPAIALFTYALVAEETQPQTAGAPALTVLTPGLSDTQVQERIEYHRKMTGWKLNRERIDVQIGNHMSAPALEAGIEKQKAPNMMNGLPLVGEAHPYSRARDRLLPADPTRVEVQIQQQLSEQQKLAEVERLEREAYMREFVANAAADGYAVEIDQDGNVKSTRLPSSGQ